MNVAFRNTHAGMTKERGVFKSFIIDGAKNTGTLKKLPKEQLGGAQKGRINCRY